MEDLIGGPDERRAQLENLDAVDAVWLRRQLELALEAWAADDTELDIDRESRVDY